MGTQNINQSYTYMRRVGSFWNAFGFPVVITLGNTGIVRKRFIIL